MGSIDELVKKAQGSALKARPVLPIGQPLSLGAVGYLDDGAFRYVGTVETLLDVSQGPSDCGPAELADIELQSSKGFTLEAYTAGTSSKAFGDVAKGQARAELGFASSDSFALAARGLTTCRLREPALLTAAMLRAYHEGLWQENYCVVYELTTAQRFSAIMSAGSQAKLLLTGKGTFGQGIATLGDVAVNVRVVRQSGTVQKVLAKKNFPAFFNAYRVKDRWIRSDIVQVASAIAHHVPPASMAEQVSVPTDPFDRV